MRPAPADSGTVAAPPLTPALTHTPAWLPAIALGVVAAVTRLPRLGAKSLWLDEAVAVHIAQLDVGGIVAASRSDTTPPLYYLVLGAFERLFGISEAAVRLPSVLASGATGAVLFFLADRWVGRLAAYVVAVLFVLSDVNLAFAREARPYALASLLCAVAFTLFLRAVERRRWRDWIALAVVNGAMMFTHYVAVFAIAAQGIALLWPWRDFRSLRHFVAAHVPIASVFIAWLLPLLSSGQAAHMDWLQRPNLFHLAKLLAWFTGGHQGFPGFLVLLVGSGAAFAMARRARRDVPWRVVGTFAIWGFAPLFLALIVSRLGILCFHARYLLYASSGLMLVWATAAPAFPSRRGRAAAVLLGCAVAAIDWGRSARHRAPDWRAAAAAVHSGPPAHVLLSPWWELRTFAYYFDRAAFRDAPNTAARLAAEGVEPIVDPNRLDALDLRGPRLALVTPGAADPHLEEALAARGYTPYARETVDGVTVVRLASTRVGTR